VLLGALWPGLATANVTIGSSLSRATNGSWQTAGPTVYVQTSLNGAQLTSPVDGTLVAWRIRGARTNGMANPNDVTLRVLRPDPGGQFVGAGSSGLQTLPNNLDDDVTRTFSASIPIHVGDQIALAGGPNFAAPIASYSGPTLEEFNAFVDGASSGSPMFTNLPGELQFNADIATPAGTPAAPKKCKKGRKLKKGKCVKKKKKRK
jgi:hypothetical protein